MKHLAWAVVLGLAVEGAALAHDGVSVEREGTSRGRTVDREGASRAPASPLTLADAIARARQVSPATRAARERFTGARDAADRTVRWLNPSLEVRSENWGGTAGAPLDTFVVVSQPLELSGTRGARLRVAAADQQQAETGARTAEQAITRDVATRYLAALGAREALRYIGEQRDGLREVVAALDRRVAEGAAPEADLRKFEAELETVETMALRLDLDLGRLRTELSAWLATPDLDADQLVVPAPPPASEAPDEAALDAALERRSDVQAARARLERAEQAAALERARGRPDLVLQGGYKRTSNTNTGVVAVLVPIPIADRNAAAVARSEGEARAAAIELDGVRRLARAEAVGLVTRAQALRARAQRAEAALVAPATIVRGAARASFREGAFDALRLVDAERVWTEAHRTQLSLQLDAVLAFLEARLALGLEVLP